MKPATGLVVFLPFFVLVVSILRVATGARLDNDLHPTEPKTMPHNDDTIKTQQTYPPPINTNNNNNDLAAVEDDDDEDERDDDMGDPRYIIKLLRKVNSEDYQHPNPLPEIDWFTNDDDSGAPSPPPTNGTAPTENPVEESL